MNTVKAVIFIACIIGVITSMTDIATHEGAHELSDLREL